MRRPILLLGAALLLTSAGCARSVAQPTPSPTPVSTPAPTTSVVTVAPTPTLLPTAAAPEPVLSGDAATNPACQLLTAAEISAQVGAGVREIRGLTSPGAYGKTGLSCTWYLDSTDIGIPSVTVQWEFPVTTWHDPVVGLYHDFIDQDLAVPIDGVGDFAMLQGSTAEAIEEERIVRVSVLQHIEPTEKDKADDIALLKLLLERTDQP